MLYHFTTMSQRVNIVVDVQGFHDDECKRFIFKDVAFIAYTEDVGVIDRFSSKISSPKPFKDVKCAKTRKSAMWLTRFYHGIHWDDPGILYEDMVTTLRSFDTPDAVVYVKGEEKALWMRRIYKHAVIQDLGSFGCPAIHRLKKVINNNCFVRAYGNVKILLSWMNENKLYST